MTAAGLPLLVLGTASTAVLLRRALVSVTVRGTSMEPAYHDGDRVLALRGRTPTAGHVVVLERPGPGRLWSRPPLPPWAGAAAVSGRHWMIKRVRAAPGDVLTPQDAAAFPLLQPGRVPPGNLVLLGDNHRSSLDSRQVGYFPATRVLGIALLARSGRTVTAAARSGENFSPCP
ncbi:S26 family signal peptidase [Streptomyces chrestomyceticus]|uniref:S26 family signal peptidase n=1 Tax=Streptomyces chrestomyceticus TaxID=68185 RepID=UPI003411928C